MWDDERLTGDEQGTTRTDLCPPSFCRTQFRPLSALCSSILRPKCTRGLYSISNERGTTCNLNYSLTTRATNHEPQEPRQMTAMPPGPEPLMVASTPTTTPTHPSLNYEMATAKRVTTANPPSPIPRLKCKTEAVYGSAAPKTITPSLARSTRCRGHFDINEVSCIDLSLV